METPEPESGAPVALFPVSDVMRNAIDGDTGKPGLGEDVAMGEGQLRNALSN